MYRVGLDTVRSSNFCAVCRGCVFYNKLTATVVYFVFGQLLIRLESILSIYNAFVCLFDTDRLVRVNLFFCFVPKQKLCIKFVPLKVADVHIASQFPKFLFLVIISCIGFDAGIDVKQRIEFLDYLKAVCVIMVIITHYGWEDKTSPFFTMLINMAVPVFMIVSGYNFAMSNRKKADGNLEKMYGWNMMKPKLIRFLLPFFAICLLEILLLAAQDKNIPLFRIFVLGAYGPGSYYVPIMLQLLVIFPLIYVMIAYNAKLGLAVAALANLAFEVCVIVFDMDKYYYRLSIGRYLLLIAFGCYLYLHPEQRVKPYQMWMMFLAGLAYLIAVFGFDKDFELFGYWKTTAMPVAFYIFPIVILLFRKFYHCTIPGFAGRLLTQIGKASYHIFLIQMVYYHFELGGAIMQTAWYIAVPFNILVTVPLGLGFYELDNQFVKKLREVKHYIRAVV